MKTAGEARFRDLAEPLLGRSDIEQSTGHQAPGTEHR